MRLWANIEKSELPRQSSFQVEYIIFVPKLAGPDLLLAFIKYHFCVHVNTKLRVSQKLHLTSHGLHVTETLNHDSSEVSRAAEDKLIPSLSPPSSSPPLAAKQKNTPPRPLAPDAPPPSPPSPCSRAAALCGGSDLFTMATTMSCCCWQIFQFLS